MTLQIIGSLFAALALQTLWITHALSGLGARMTRIESKLDRIETLTLKEHGERIARLEQRAEQATRQP